MFKTIKKYNLKGISFHNSINSAKNFKIIYDLSKISNQRMTFNYFCSSRNNSSGDKYSIIKDFENIKKVLYNARCGRRSCVPA